MKRRSLLKALLAAPIAFALAKLPAREPRGAAVVDVLPREEVAAYFDMQLLARAQPFLPHGTFGVRTQMPQNGVSVSFRRFERIAAPTTIPEIAS